MALPHATQRCAQQRRWKRLQTTPGRCGWESGQHFTDGTNHRLAALVGVRRTLALHQRDPPLRARLPSGSSCPVCPGRPTGADGEWSSLLARVTPIPPVAERFIRAIFGNLLAGWPTCSFLSRYAYPSGATAPSARALRCWLAPRHAGGLRTGLRTATGPPRRSCPCCGRRSREGTPTGRGSALWPCRSPPQRCRPQRSCQARSGSTRVVCGTW